MHTYIKNFFFVPSVFLSFPKVSCHTCTACKGQNPPSSPPGMGLKTYICKLQRFLWEWKGQAPYDLSGHRLRPPQNETAKRLTLCAQKPLLHLYSVTDWFTLTVILAGAVCLKENCFQWLTSTDSNSYFAAEVVLRISYVCYWRMTSRHTLEDILILWVGGHMFNPSSLFKDWHLSQTC